MIDKVGVLGGFAVSTVMLETSSTGLEGLDHRSNFFLLKCATKYVSQTNEFIIT